MELLKLFASFSTTEQIICCIFGVIVIIVLFLLKRIGNGIKTFLANMFKNKRIKVVVDDDTAIQAEEVPQAAVGIPQAIEPSSGTGKDLSKDVLILLLAVIQAYQTYINKVMMMRYVEALRSQMEFTEDKINILFNAAEQTFGDILKSIANDDAERIKKSYTTFISVVKVQLKESFRLICKDTNIVNKTDEEFTVFVNNNVILLTDVYVNSAKDFFQNSSTPIIEAEINRVKPLISDTIRTCIVYAREASVKKSKEIKDIQSVFVKDYERITGNSLPEGLLNILD